MDKEGNKILIIILISYTIFLMYIGYYICIPYIIEKRYKSLDLMKYNGKEDKFIPKDSINLTRYEIIYIQYGKFE